jgi:hypothetical protein
VRFAGSDRAEVYGWVERLLCQQEYPLQKRRSKGLLRAYVEHMTGLSRAQSTRLVGRYLKTGRVAVEPSRRPHFPRRYTPADIELLASVDEAHEQLSGPATQHILKREFEVYGQGEFERLAGVCNGHLYNLRQTERYRQRLRHYEKTRPTAVSIGERRKPAPNGQPGFLRIDTVHQGDGPEGKGIYHINAVDEVTQWQIVLATPYISEAWLMPLLESIFEQFPFLILNFHTDNGSEFINKRVAELLEKLLIEQTKSRPRRSGDNGLVETKTPPSYASTSAGDTSRRSMPRPSIGSIPASSTPTSTTTAPRPRPKSRSTRRDASAASTNSGAHRLKRCLSSTSRNSFYALG